MPAVPCPQYRLYDAAPGPRQAFWVEGARHNDVLSVAGARYFRTLEAFAALVRRSGTDS
jgi:abhydrolase domain-containing protein 17